MALPLPSTLILTTLHSARSSQRPVAWARRSTVVRVELLEPLGQPQPLHQPQLTHAWRPWKPSTVLIAQGVGYAWRPRLSHAAAKASPS